ncbi:hypothetical protein HPB50_005583 [Hyalomma asiaticum]|uniref:Uncharacterized protein n=1 Tax=Hyalomma asiaticum TaxID=266040 RepID=A0ACB7TBF4_HYAAI|nr:hypothetical protein HPB50_005583 [Hyalomma asiaticum]
MITWHFSLFLNEQLRRVLDKRSRKRAAARGVNPASFSRGAGRRRGGTPRVTWALLWAEVTFLSPAAASHGATGGRREAPQPAVLLLSVVRHRSEPFGWSALCRLSFRALRQADPITADGTTLHPSSYTACTPPLSSISQGASPPGATPQSPAHTADFFVPSVRVSTGFF